MKATSCGMIILCAILVCFAIHCLLKILAMHGHGPYYTPYKEYKGIRYNLNGVNYPIEEEYVEKKTKVKILLEFLKKCQDNHQETWWLGETWSKKPSAFFLYHQTILKKKFNALATIKLEKDTDYFIYPKKNQVHTYFLSIEFNQIGPKTKLMYKKNWAVVWVNKKGEVNYTRPTLTYSPSQKYAKKQQYFKIKEDDFLKIIDAEGAGILISPEEHLSQEKIQDLDGDYYAFPPTHLENLGKHEYTTQARLNAFKIPEVSEPVEVTQAEKKS